MKFAILRGFLVSNKLCALGSSFFLPKKQCVAHCAMYSLSLSPDGHEHSRFSLGTQDYCKVTVLILTCSYAWALSRKPRGLAVASWVLSGGA